MEDQFHGVLTEGERLLWTGQPEPRLFTAIDFFLVPFSIVWGGFAIFWEFMVLTTIRGKAGPVAVIFPLFGIPFVLAGLYFIFGRFIYKQWRRRNTYFAVSNRRVMIRYRGNLQSLYIDTLPVLDLSVKQSDGSGTLKFGHTPLLAGMYFNTGLEIFPMQGTTVPSFYDIKEARHVYDIIDGARHKGNVG
jgi:hypothetical protein